MPGTVCYPADDNPDSSTGPKVTEEMLSYIHATRYAAPTQWSECRPKYISPVSTKEGEMDYAQFIVPLGFVSLDRLKTTFQHSTKLASNWIKLPLQRHFKSRMPQLNCPRLN